MDTIPPQSSKNNPDTGRGELHIPLPDEHVIRQWIELIGGVLGGLNPKPLTMRNTEPTDEPPVSGSA